MKDAKKFASTKHKGLPEKKVKKESVEHVGNSDFRSSAEFMNTFAKLKDFVRRTTKSAQVIQVYHKVSPKLTGEVKCKVSKRQQ